MVRQLFNWLFNIRDHVELERPKSFSESSTPLNKGDFVNKTPPLPSDETVNASIDLSALFYSLLLATPPESLTSAGNNRL